MADLNLPELHDEALASTRHYVAGIGTDQWKAPSLCEGWDVRELVNHIVSGNYWAGELARGKTIEEVGDRLAGDILGDDPLGEYDTSSGAASAAFHMPGAMEAPCAVSYGPVPGEVYAGHRFLDVVIHGWDVAKATGQDTKLAPELVEACWAVVEPQKDLLVGSGMFGSDHDAPAGADRQTALLALLGRTA
ncbi:MAG: TIGR03086 family metal-binding protein [Actinomycetota bacterium]